MKLCLLAAGVVLLLSIPERTRADECVGITSFAEIAKRADMVFTGKVIAVQAPRVRDWRSRGFRAENPDFADVEIESVVRGKTPATVVRVWDVFAGTAGGGGLRSLQVGMRAEFAVGPAGSWNEGTREPAAPVPHPTAAYTCGLPWRELKLPKAP